MRRCLLVRVIAAAVGTLAVSACGGERRSLSPTTPSTTSASLAVTAVRPNTGVTGRWVRIVGAGFTPVTTVTLDGIAATKLLPESSVAMFALVPTHAAGPVDIVLTNPNGESVKLIGGFTYQIVTVSVSPSTVEPGGQLTVSWVAPANQGAEDWIGLYKAGGSNEDYVWYEYTDGRTSGTLTISAPAQPGVYEFRYLVDDSYNDAARSGPVMVGAAPQSS
jgi:IPT/TIG domain